MDLLDRLLGHDVWTTRELLRRCESLSGADLDRPFDIGHRSVRVTFVHVIRNMEVWTALMAGTPLPPRTGADSIPALVDRLDRAAEDLACLARRIANEDRWDDLWLDRLDDPPRHKTFGGAVAHVLTHSMHHRAQLLYMLRRLGVRDLPEGDVLTWESQSRVGQSTVQTRQP